MKKTSLLIILPLLATSIFADNKPQTPEAQRALALQRSQEMAKDMENEEGLVKKAAAIRKGHLSLYGDEKRDQLVDGAQFIDWFTYIPDGKITSDVWGDVVPRNVDNGIEDSKYSYWGGNIILGDDGKYHQFVCRWPEDISRSNGKSGHNLWWDSTVVHAVSQNPTGPFKVLEEVGKGHNPEIFRNKDGSYTIIVMGKKGYKAKSLNGPWEKFDQEINYIKGNTQKTSNCTFIVRNDGSIFMIDKLGHQYTTNEKGQFQGISSTPIYRRIGAPPFGNSGEEDPVIWKDDVNYNCIVNSPYLPEAFLFTSADGITWKREEGVAFTNRIVKHKDGSVEKWRWMERPKVLKDKYDRVTHMNFAAIDIIKQFDIANDNHSSKNVVVPMIVNKRLELLSNKDDAILKIKILSEEGFDAIKDVDVKSLKFGNFTAVNFGEGAKATKSYANGKDLIVEFKNADTKLTQDDYKAKLLGKLNNKEKLWGKVRLTALPEVY